MLTPCQDKPLVSADLSIDDYFQRTTPADATPDVLAQSFLQDKFSTIFRTRFAGSLPQASAFPRTSASSQPGPSPSPLRDPYGGGSYPYGGQPSSPFRPFGPSVGSGDLDPFNPRGSGMFAGPHPGAGAFGPQFGGPPGFGQGPPPGARFDPWGPPMPGQFPPPPFGGRQPQPQPRGTRPPFIGGDPDPDHMEPPGPHYDDMYM